MDVIRRDGSSPPLSTTAISAIAAGVGAFLLVGIVVPVYLLLRARRNHQRLIADLEKRGVFIAQASKDATDSVAKPRNVLRRNTGLPFDTKSGWAAIQSVESIRTAGSSSGIAHYVPPKPPQGVKKTSRLSWPFHTRRISGHSVQMQKLKSSRLSTVIEDPKQSPLVPILGSAANASRLSVATSTGGASIASSSQSLLRNHPAFRSPEKDDVGQTSHRTRTYFRSDANQRVLRARSVAAVPTSPVVRPHLRARSASSTQISGKAPDVILPPLPMDIDRIKQEEVKRPHLKHALSKSSVSSVESADTSILGSRLSPIIPRATKTRAQRIVKPASHARPFRDTLDLRAKVLSSQDTLLNSTARSSSTPQLQRPPLQHQPRRPRPNSGSAAFEDIERTQSMHSDAGPYPTASPLVICSSPTKRRSMTYVSSSGSPEKQFPVAPSTRALTGTMRSPKRQHSQTSSRSSCGNPFQWDATPLTPGRKPSALKGSPGARQGHRRKNSVRISLVPTFHGPPSREASSTLLVEPQQHQQHQQRRGQDIPRKVFSGGFNDAQAAAPPRSSTFSPDLKFKATTIQASLTTNSPSLPLVTYEESFVVSPTDHVLPQLSPKERNRLSNGSMFSLSNFPSTPSIIEPVNIDLMNIPQGGNERSFVCNIDLQAPSTPYLAQQPFDTQGGDHHFDTTEESLFSIPGYDPEQLSLVFQTPPHKTVQRPFSMAFSTILEESSVTSAKTLSSRRSPHNDSPPVSPKTPSPPRFNTSQQVYNVPVNATCIPEEPVETIDPAVLCKDAFTMADSGYGSSCGVNEQFSTRETSGTNSHDCLGAKAIDHSSFLQAVESPILGHLNRDSSTSSIYFTQSPINELSRTSSPDHWDSTVAPCSPRPAHASLPVQNNLSINFAEMPKLNPSPRGPRDSPSRPLRSSIAALRRMNSDAADAKKNKSGRGERRYLRIGREESVNLPGDESWLDDLEDEEDNQELDEEESRRLVGSVLDEWDEGYGMLDVEDSSIDTTRDIKPTKTVNPYASRQTPDGDEDTCTGAQEDDNTSLSQHSSSIWEDGEVFWSSSTPPPPLISPTPTTKPKLPYQPAASSPLITCTTPSSTPTRKRRGEFSVAKDSPTPSAPASPTENITKHDAGVKKRRESQGSRERRRRSESGSRYRKRHALGVGTPNVRIQVTSPGGHVSGGSGAGGWAPGSLYDAQGFLRF